MKKDTRIIVGICLLFLLTAGFLFVKQQKESAGAVQGLSLVEEGNPALGQGEERDSGGEQENSASLVLQQKEQPAIQNEGDISEGTECAVYVSGAVKKPGLYRYKGAARVCDAIDAVGGFAKNADTDSVNLARMLSDGEQIHVPTKAQVKKQEGQENPAAQETAEVQVGDGGAGLVDINRASANELMTLPGIGQAKADLIINYRSEHGPFAKKEDLMQISGIKEGTFNKIKELITVT